MLLFFFLVLRFGQGQIKFVFYSTRIAVLVQVFEKQKKKNILLYIARLCNIRGMRMQKSSGTLITVVRHHAYYRPEEYWSRNTIFRITFAYNV